MTSAANAHLLESLTKESNSIQFYSNIRSRIYKIIALTLSFTIIISGIIIGIISTLNSSVSTDDSSRTYTIATAIIGFAVSGLKSISTAYGFDRKAVTYKQINVKIKQIKRSLDIISISNLNPTDTNKMLAGISKQIDNLDLTLFTGTMPKMDNKPKKKKSDSSPNVPTNVESIGVGSNNINPTRIESADSAVTVDV